MHETVAEKLAEDLERSHPAQAAQVRERLTRIDELPVDFLTYYSVYCVQVRSLRHPLLFYAARADGRPAHLLGPSPGDLVGLLADDESALENAADAIAFVRLSVETTRRRSGLTRLVESIDEIPLRERLDEDGEKRAEQGLAHLRSSVSPPSAERTSDGWEVSLWVARGQRVGLEHYRISPQGELLAHTVESQVELPLIVVA